MIVKKRFAMVYIFQLGRVNSREKGRTENVPSMPCRSILHRELGTQIFVPVLQRYQIKENIVIVKKAWSIPAGSGKPSLENIHGREPKETKIVNPVKVSFNPR